MQILPLFCLAVLVLFPTVACQSGRKKNNPTTTVQPKVNVDKASHRNHTIETTTHGDKRDVLIKDPTHVSNDSHLSHGNSSSSPGTVNGTSSSTHEERAFIQAPIPVLDQLPPISTSQPSMSQPKSSHSPPVSISQSSMGQPPSSLSPIHSPPIFTSHSSMGQPLSIQSPMQSPLSTLPHMSYSEMVPAEFVIQANFYYAWTEWSSCSASCGQGHMTRVRSCKDTGCPGPMTLVKSCYGEQCPAGADSNPVVPFQSFQASTQPQIQPSSGYMQLPMQSYGQDMASTGYLNPLMSTPQFSTVAGSAPSLTSGSQQHGINDPLGSSHTPTAFYGPAPAPPPHSDAFNFVPVWQQHDPSSSGYAWQQRDPGFGPAWQQHDPSSGFSSSQPLVPADLSFHSLYSLIEQMVETAIDMRMSHMMPFPSSSPYATIPYSLPQPPSYPQWMPPYFPSQLPQNVPMNPVIPDYGWSDDHSQLPVHSAPVFYPTFPSYPQPALMSDTAISSPPGAQNAPHYNPSANFPSSVHHYNVGGHSSTS